MAIDSEFNLLSLCRIAYIRNAKYRLAIATRDVSCRMWCPHIQHRMELPQRYITLSTTIPPFRRPCLNRTGKEAPFTVRS